MASHSEIDRTRDYIRVNIDDGSSQVRVAAQHVRVGDIVKDVPTDGVQLQEGEDKIRQKFVIDGDDFYCGELDVGNWLQQHPGEAHRVIEGCKLALCPEYQHAEATKRFYAALGVYRPGQLGDIKAFKIRFYRWVRARVIAFYRDLSPKGIGYKAQYWNEIQIECMITVPAMWEVKQTTVILNAAEAAGFKNLTLRPEPQCAAAREMSTLKQRVYIKDDPFLWCDIGNATVDFALVRIEEPSGPGEPPNVVMVRKALGKLLGSHIVDRLAWNHIEQCADVAKHGGLEVCLQMLGNMTEAEFIRQAMERVEDEKKKSPCRPFTISINAMDDWIHVDGGRAFLDIRITKQEIESWLDRWTQQLVGVLASYVQVIGPNNIGAIVTTGGGASNKTVFAGLKHAADEVKLPLISTDDRDNPVAKGGLLLYQANEPDELPRKGKGRTELNPLLTKPSKAGDGDSEVVERLALIARTRADEATVESHAIPYTFEIEAQWNPRLEFDIYFSETFEANGKPLLDKSGEMRPIFKRVQMQDADLTGMDWESHSAALSFFQHEGKRWFHLDGIIEMIATDSHWDLRVTILEPGEEFRWVDHCTDEAPAKRQKTDTPNRSRKRATESQVDTKHDYKTIFKTTQPIWDRYCSNAMRNVYDATSVGGLEPQMTARKQRNRVYPSTPRTMETRLHTANSTSVLVPEATDLMNASSAKTSADPVLKRSMAEARFGMPIWAATDKPTPSPVVSEATASHDNEANTNSMSSHAATSTATTPCPSTPDARSAAALLSNIINTDGVRRPPSGKRAMRSGHTSPGKIIVPRARQPDRRAELANTSPGQSRYGICDSGLGTPPVSVEQGRQPERPQSNVQSKGALARLKARQAMTSGNSGIQ